MYYLCDWNPKSKKELRERVKAGGKVRVLAVEPGERDDVTGVVAVAGPRYPQPHRWYAQCEVVNGVVVSVK